MPLSYETSPGDIDHLIADDHAVVERQFQHLEAGHGNRRVLVDQISFELALHAFGEETVLYPLWRTHSRSITSSRSCWSCSLARSRARPSSRPRSPI